MEFQIVERYKKATSKLKYLFSLNKIIHESE